MCEDWGRGCESWGKRKLKYVSSLAKSVNTRKVMCLTYLKNKQIHFNGNSVLVRFSKLTNWVQGGFLLITLIINLIVYNKFILYTIFILFY